MEDNRTERIAAYIEEQLESGYEPKKITAMLVHAWDMDVLEAQDTVKEVLGEVASRKQKRRSRAKTQSIVGGIFLAEAVIHAYIFGPVIFAGITATVGIVLLGFALKNMR